MHSRDFKVPFLYEWGRKHNAAATAGNINASFGNGSANKPFNVGMQISNLGMSVSQTITGKD